MTTTPVAPRFTSLHTPEQFESLVVESEVRAMVIFKHSPTCGTSAMAYDELSDVIAEGTQPIYLLDVLAARELSRMVAAQTGVRHESPQVLILRDRVVRWSATHYRITADAVRNAVGAAMAGQP